MMRALYTAATGMTAEQTNVDTIANNLANVNTTGYKTERTEFKSLLYQEIQTVTTSANGQNKPIGAQAGLGVRVAATSSLYTQGSLTETGNLTDFAIDGDGFFAVRGLDGQTYFTRNGNFTWSLDADGNTIVALINDALGLAVWLKYNVRELPCIAEWKVLRDAEYVLAFEPGNCHPIGRDRQRELGHEILRPMESRSAHLEIGICDGADEIAALEREIAARR